MVPSAAGHPRCPEKKRVVPTVFNGIPDVNLVLLEKNLSKNV